MMEIVQLIQMVVVVIMGTLQGASGLHDVYEAVHQMRGDAGATQVKNDVNRAMIRGFGGSQNVLNIMMEKK